MPLGRDRCRNYYDTSWDVLMRISARDDPFEPLYNGSTHPWRFCRSCLGFDETYYHSAVSESFGGKTQRRDGSATCLMAPEDLC